LRRQERTLPPLVREPDGVDVGLHFLELDAGGGDGGAGGATGAAGPFSGAGAGEGGAVVFAAGEDGGGNGWGFGASHTNQAISARKASAA
jgi:hypothetical protein